MKRRKARELALSLVYAAPFQEELPLADLYATALREQEWEDDPYVRKLFFGVCEQLPELDARIAAHADGWKLARMPKVSLAIMRIAVYEMLHCDDVPFEAAIDEALELAKAYDYDKAPPFINGVLNAIATSEGLKGTSAKRKNAEQTVDAVTDVQTADGDALAPQDNA